jgi:hypothetical protein
MKVVMGAINDDARVRAHECGSGDGHTELVVGHLIDLVIPEGAGDRCGAEREAERGESDRCPAWHSWRGEGGEAVSRI